MKPTKTKIIKTCHGYKFKEILRATGAKYVITNSAKEEIFESISKSLASTEFERICSEITIPEVLLSSYIYKVRGNLYRIERPDLIPSMESILRNADYQSLGNGIWLKEEQICLVVIDGDCLEIKRFKTLKDVNFGEEFGNEQFNY